MAHVHVENHGHAATIDILPDDIFLEIFAFCTCDPDRVFAQLMGQWQTLVHVCQRWRQIIFASPRYLDLFLYFSKRTPVRNLSCWPAFPIAILYSPDPDDDLDDVIALLNHPNRVRFVRLTLTGSQLGKVVAAMQESFPLLKRLELDASEDVLVPVLPGFLGGSAPCLRVFELAGIPFPELPTLLLSCHDLVYLHIERISTIGYISPEAMAAGLAMLTRLKTLRIGFQFWVPPPEQRARHLDPPMRTVLPALTEFGFWAAHVEYLEDFVARLDTPRLDDVWTLLDRIDSLWLPQLSLFIALTGTLRFTRAWVEFSNQSFKIELNRSEREFGDLEPSRPRFSLSTSLGWAGTHIAHATHVLGRVFAIFSDVVHLYIRASEDHPGWQDDIDRADWLTFFHLFRTVETLHISGRLAGQVARALADIPGETVTEVFPSLRLLFFDDDERQVESTEHFVSLRQLYGRPVAIIDLQTIRLAILGAYHGNQDQGS
ncbi:hypothetical protein EDB89DRAFT_2073116 [Lactarius sanguifluus]|nr:hypothetical protein EDB89DRAFT_2073116 [Lactarius sanguifluus]